MGGPGRGLTPWVSTADAIRRVFRLSRRPRDSWWRMAPPPPPEPVGALRRYFWACGGHRRRCCRTGCCHNRLLFLRNRLLRRRHRLQGDVNRIGCELRRCACALRLRTHRYRLQLVAAQRERHGKLAAGLDRQLASMVMLSLSKANMSCRRRAFAKSRLRLTPPCQCAIGMTPGRVQSAFLRSQWFGSFVSLSVRCEYACLSSPDILGCYRLARRASVTTNGSRKLERALLSSSDWRHNMRG